ncbi:MAG: hypothetical protein WKF83_04995 [Nocardioidaceae bacterium]
MLATVKGDVHDIGKNLVDIILTNIGKNLVDIILTNNGYTVVSLGIKQPVQAILDGAEEAPRRPGDRDVRATGQEHSRDEGKTSRSLQLARTGGALAGHARRCRAHPRLRRAGPRRAVRRRGPLRRRGTPSRAQGG